MKKGEITTQQIVFLIILILSFAIILFFIFRLDFASTSNKEICYNSVVLFEKSKISGEIDLFGKLDCRTNYLCISQGEKCKDFSADSSAKVLTKEELFKTLADGMSDCWWMFGEGKIDFTGLTDLKSQCAICSIVKFGDKLSEKYSNGISGEEFDTFLMKEKRTEQQTYFQYLYGEETSDGIPGVWTTPKSIDLSKKYVIFMGQEKFGGNPIFSSLISIENISSVNLCDRFDLSKAN